MRIVYFAESVDGEHTEKFLKDMHLRELSNSYGNGHLLTGVYGPYATEAEAKSAHPEGDVWPVNEERVEDLQDSCGRYLA